MSSNDANSVCSLEDLAEKRLTWPPPSYSKSVTSMTFWSTSDLSCTGPPEINVEVLSLSSLVNQQETLSPAPSLGSFTSLFKPGEAEFDPSPTVLTWLETLFVEDRFAPLPELSVLELKFCLKILQRRFRMKGSTLPRDRDELVEQILKIEKANKSIKPKRTEENNKFVFKHTVKLMKSQLMSEEPRTLSTQEAGALLIQRFGLEGNSLNKGALSICRLKDIFQNKPFALEFLKYVRDPSVKKSRLLQLYTASVRRKLTKLLKKWGRLDGQQSNDAGAPGPITDFLLSRSQCKLPWSHSELLGAVRCFLHTIGEPSD